MKLDRGYISTHFRKVKFSKDGGKEEAPPVFVGFGKEKSNAGIKDLGRRRKIGDETFVVAALMAMCHPQANCSVWCTKCLVCHDRIHKNLHLSEILQGHHWSSVRDVEHSSKHDQHGIWSGNPHRNSWNISLKLFSFHMTSPVFEDNKYKRHHHSGHVANNSSISHRNWPFLQGPFPIKRYRPRTKPNSCSVCRQADHIIYRSNRQKIYLDCAKTDCTAGLPLKLQQSRLDIQFQLDMKGD
ncbi:unnamed protein product [Fraxinus pennsylvanica]|uniref:Uncharacterized protein n=1 Tax=Fraxinus pennsylvanica TaxID=56036 RepID=A0AAD2A646_9LAMI|nr:unnamed protein product [Fraxinus pennsylvanica]